MSSKIFRTAAAALLFSTLVSLGAAPAQAWGTSGRRAFDGPARAEREGGFFARLLRIFDFAGGAMDPNGGK
ncbi:MAG TPA: hypothetical protein VHC97_03660 [Thermoanaerobaculia bacterium]|jgi:hypothetical protein|nr:hypothetical protein [Thermoanaerobaculia bacterium]